MIHFFLIISIVNGLQYERLREVSICSTLDKDDGIDTHLKQHEVVRKMILFII
jgi:hypothetical protein